jgi:hypothetical protein
VYRLDPLRLVLRRRIELPFSVRAITAGPSAVWVGGPGRLDRIDPGSGAVAAPVPVDGEVTSLSADPTGRRLYAAASTARGAVVSERDARSGTLLGSHRLGPGTARVAAVAGGVWVWQDRPAAPAMVRLRSGDLRPTAAFTAAPGVAWLRGAVTGSLLWVADPTTLSCADPLTGRVRATWASPPSQQVLAADSSRVALLAAGRVVVFPADPRCG